MNIILIGKPGAGKGTVSAYLKAKYGIPYFSTGDMLRSEIQKGTELGLLAKSIIDEGNLMPSHIVNEIVRVAIKDLNDGCILDGFPRKIKQALALEDILSDKGTKLDAALFLDIEDGVIIERLSHRRVCPKCNSTYHLLNSPSKVEGICDQCHAELVIREDDKPEYIMTRLEAYEKDTKPILAYYEEQRLLQTINTNCSVDEMYRRVEECLSYAKN